MRVKYIVLGIASSFIVLLIVGAIFAIKAATGGNSTDTAVGSSANPAVAAAQTSASPPPNPLSAPESPAVNPLSATTPPASPASAGDADPASIGYTILASTNSGHAIFAQKSDATTPESAILAALRDMTRILDSKPTVRGAFADSQQQHRGGATFTGVLNSQPIKGNIICGIGDNGAAITIIYDRADAPASDWATLANALPVNLQMQQQTVGDGAATLSVPSDWKIASASNLGSVLINGPAQQSVGLGLGMEVITPDSMTAAAQNQLAAVGRLTPAMRTAVAPFTGPADALRNLMPQLSETSQANGGPAFTLDEMLQSTDVASQLPGGQAARLYYRSTDSQNGQETHKRNWAQVECYPIGAGAWGMYWSYVSAPDATFDADLPTMLAISKSWKLNDDIVNQHGQQNVAAQNAQFSAFEQSNKETQDAFDGYLKSIQHDSLLTDRSNTDFDEVVRGFRTVYDTRTDERAPADLGNVDEIVNSLNERDPGRYIQIPLRDEAFPLTPGN